MPPLPDLSAAIATPVGGVVVFLATLGALLGLRYFVLHRLKRWSVSTTTRVDDIIVGAVYTPSLFWSVALSIKAAVLTSPLDASLRDVFSRAITVLVLLSMTLVGASMAGGIVTEILRRQSPDGQVPGLGQSVVRTVVVLLGGLVVLKSLGVEITPLLTALGVGGLAVALALQDSLTNFFAGLHILLERPYNIGQFIRLEDGQEGHVLDIGWRTTRIRTLQDDVIVVPNSKMAGSTIVNYHMPFPGSRVTVRVGVAYASDADHVRGVLLDLAERERAAHGYLLATPAPEALLVQLADSALVFELRFHVSDIAKQVYALDQMHRAVLRRFREEGIEIPFPTRTVLLHQSG